MAEHVRLSERIAAFKHKLCEKIQETIANIKIWIESTERFLYKQVEHKIVLLSHGD